MIPCLPYRYFLTLMSSLGLLIVIGFRAAFALVVTHTTKMVESGLRADTFFTNCTAYNTSSDYVSKYTQETGIQFHTLHFAGMFLSMISSGHVTSFFPADRIIGVGTLVSSLLFLMVPTVFTWNSTGVFIIRFLQGIFEGVGQPALVVLINVWSLDNEKSTMLSLAFVGVYLSPAVTEIFVGACLCYVSWNSPIYILGGAGVVWSLLFTWLVHPSPQDCPYLGEKELPDYATKGSHLTKSSISLAKDIPWKEILTSKPVWSIWLGCFCKNFVTATVTALQPQFFKDVFGIRAADIGLILSVPFFVNTVFIFLFSYLSDVLISSKRLSVTNTRKLMQCVGVASESLFFVCMIYAHTWQLSFTFLTLAYVIGGMTFSGYSCNMLDLSVQYSGAVSAIGISGVIGAVASTFLASLVAGKKSTSGNWAIVFWTEAAVAMATAVVYFFFASGERQGWDEYDAISTREKIKEDKIPLLDLNKVDTEAVGHCDVNPHSS